MDLKVIAYARNGHTDKFGIPRQSREESPILTRIVFEPEYRIREAIRGIEGFSHLWILWGFDKEKETNIGYAQVKHRLNLGAHSVKSPVVNWSPTVRPPRLGGNKRVGVFATRSPFRPNPIGMSSVRLVRVGEGELIVSGADVLDGTPIYDIKPYLSFSDSHPDAKNGFAEETKDYGLRVSGEGLEEMPEDVRRDIEYILSQDPRPGYQHDPDREYKLEYSGWRVTFQVENNVISLKKTEKT